MTTAAAQVAPQKNSTTINSQGRKTIIACKWFRETLEAADNGTMVTLRQLEMLLRIADNKGVGQVELAQAMAVPPSSISKNAKILGQMIVKSATGAKVDVGMGLIEQRPDDFEGRRKNLHLTRKGEKLMATFCEYLNGGA